MGQTDCLVTGYESEWPKGIRDHLGWMMMLFAEANGKGIDS